MVRIERNVTLADFGTCMFCHHAIRQVAMNKVDLDDYCEKHGRKIDELDSCQQHYLDRRISDLFRDQQFDRLKGVLVDSMVAYTGSE